MDVIGFLPDGMKAQHCGWNWVSEMLVQDNEVKLPRCDMLPWTLCPANDGSLILCHL